MHAGHAHHHHAHAHGHAHAPADFGRAFAIGVALNLAYVGIEAGIGVWMGSLALIADAGHNLSDVLGLAAAWAASLMAKAKPTPRFTYGYGAASILAALFNALLLLVACGAIAWEAVERLARPAAAPGPVIMAVAGLGFVVNAATAMLFFSGRKGDLNVRGAFLHLASDALVSLGVVGAGLAIWISGAAWIDPAVSLAIVAIIVAGTWSLLRDSTGLALNGAPVGVDMGKLRAALRDAPGVADLHDLHVWPISTAETALTAHLIMPGGHPGDEALCALAKRLKREFPIHHVTLQVELGDGGPCAEARHA